MKIQDLIKILQSCENQEEEIVLAEYNGHIFVMSNFKTKCKYCDGTGEREFETLDPDSVGYCSNGDYKEPSYIEYTDTCNKCSGEGFVVDTDVCIEIGEI